MHSSSHTQVSDQFSVLLESPSFKDRLLVKLPKKNLQTNIVCPLCSISSTLSDKKTKGNPLTCGHMIQCTECRDYNLEKILRCEKCCNSLVGYFPEGCCSTCPRNTATIKASALCTVCNSHLRKEARCCKSSPVIKQCKKVLRSSITVLVQNPVLIATPSASDRPCSHYTLCQFCKSSVTKGHRSSTACKSCKNNRKRSMSPEEKKINAPAPKKRKNPFDALSILAAESSDIYNHRVPNFLSSTPSPVMNVRNSRFGENGAIPLCALLNA